MSDSDFPLLLRRRPELFRCPLCASRLEAEDRPPRLRCFSCGESYPFEEGVPLLFRPDPADRTSAVSERVRAFYEEVPFPDYEDLGSSASLVEKARRGTFARLLDEQLPARARVLDAGCGTGQLANYLALAPGRTVVAADLCLGSLRLAQAFKRANQIDNVAFLQMDLFRPALEPASFDLVIATGVLHHTADPLRGLRELTSLARPGGHVLVGLYNRLGRIPTDLRRLLIRISGGRLAFTDPRLRGAALSERRKRAWLLDQYRHPHESKHTFGEVLGWFEACALDFVSGVPRPGSFRRFSPDESLFAPSPPGGSLDHLIVQLGMLLGGGREGGLFVMIGRRRPQAV